MNTVNISLVQMNALVGKIKDNLAVHKLFIRKAAKQNVQLICFPELSISGHWPHPDRWHCAETVPDGDSIRFLTKLAKQYKLHIAAGIAEKDKTSVYNTYCIIGPEGFIGGQRKLHPSRDEYFFYRGGTHLHIFDLGFAQIGVVICFDNMFPEVQRCLAIEGAEIIIMPHAVRCGKKWPLPTSIAAKLRQEQQFLVEHVLASRCYDNGQFGLYCNQTGHAGPQVNHAGGLAVIKPDGNTMVSKFAPMSNTMVCATLNATELNVRRKSSCFNLLVRKPHLYTELTKE